MKLLVASETDFAVHANVYGELLIRTSSEAERADWFVPRHVTMLLLYAASAPTPFPRSGSAPSPAARPSLDAPPGCPYVAPLRSAYWARPIAPLFPDLGLLIVQSSSEVSSSSRSSSGSSSRSP